MDRRYFPDLRIIPISKTVLHEDTDPIRVARLAAWIKRRQALLDPILVALLRPNRYIVLDGATRVAALRLLKIPHLLVQVVDYRAPGVVLETWNHLICDARFKRIFSGQVKRFTRHDVSAMRTFVYSYRGRYHYQRVADGNFSTLKRQFPDVVCLVVFPKFRPADIIRFARNGERIPAGITRHLVSGRALNMWLPLRLLQSRWTLLRKNERLARFVDDKINKNRVRYYPEPVHLFYD